MLRTVSLFLLASACSTGVALGQAKTPKLASIFQDIYGPSGLVVNSEAVLPDGSTHSAHFNSGFQSDFTQFNIALASQLTAVPLPSPASGFTYTFDSATGTFRRSTQSFGPILSDRAETIGTGRFSFGYNFQYFSFDTIEGVDLARVPAVFTHDDFQLGGGRADVVTTLNAVQASVGQTTGFLTYGVTDRLDISIAVPVVRTHLSVLSNATIQRIGTGSNQLVHFFRDPDASNGVGSQRQFFSDGTASGMGDLIVRVKGTAVKTRTTGVALGIDVRLSTGDEQNLLGAGAPGAKPFAAASFVYKRFSPHVNVGYQWNGDSVLAGDFKTGSKGDLPDQVLYVVGADVGVNDKLSLAFDLLGQYVIDSPRLVSRSLTARAESVSATFPDIGFETDSFNITNGSIGLKTNVAGRLLVNFNLRFKLNDAALRDKVSPLIGIEYGF